MKKLVLMLSLLIGLSSQAMAFWWIPGVTVDEDDSISCEDSIVVLYTSTAFKSFEKAEEFKKQITPILESYAADKSTSSTVNNEMKSDKLIYAAPIFYESIDGMRGYLISLYPACDKIEYEGIRGFAAQLEDEVKDFAKKLDYYHPASSISANLVKTTEFVDQYACDDKVGQVVVDIDYSRDFSDMFRGDSPVKVVDYFINLAKDLSKGFFVGASLGNNNKVGFADENNHIYLKAQKPEFTSYRMNCSLEYVMSFKDKFLMNSKLLDYHYETNSKEVQLMAVDSFYEFIRRNRTEI